MEIINSLILNVMHIIFPVLLYLLYIIFKKVYDQKENDLILAFTVVSVIYVALKFNDYVFEGIPYFIINIALFISIYKKSTIGVIISSFVSVVYYFMFYQNFLIVLTILYLFYYLVYLSKKNTFYKITLITIIHTAVLMAITFILYRDNYFVYTYEILFSSFYAYVIINLIIYLFKESEELLKIHGLYKEITHDKQVKNCLFQITHEIKNPIAVCKGYLDMFDVNNKEHAVKYIPIMKEEISRTLYLLEDFLSMNRLKVHKEIVDINMILESVQNHFMPIFKEKNIVFIDNLIDDEIYIDGDYNRLIQVFLNIIKNSIEAIKEDGKIEISEKISNNKVYIKIKDNGVGISKENMKHIKDAFYTTKIRGTGLGVSLSNEIIEAHDGSLNYKSEEGKYTLVTIVFPVKKI